jgi:hypothetical protein
MHDYHIKTSSNKDIYIFDDIVPLRIREKAYQVFMSSYFLIGWSDSEDPAKKANDHFIHSKYSFEDTKSLGIIDLIYANKSIADLLAGAEWSKTILNLSTTSDVNYVHSHSEKKVVLYYGNLEWRDGAHGETHFYNDNLKDIEFSSAYTPGRIIVFDGDIPHCVRPQSMIGPKYRFTLAMFFDNKEI